ncbi:dCTP deaminase [Fimbriiglobus ruber]
MIAARVKIDPPPTWDKTPGRISWGLSSYGLDVRAGYKFKIFTNAHRGVVDPKSFDAKAFVDVDLTPSGEHRFWQMWIKSPNQSGQGCARCYQTKEKADAVCPVSDRPDHVLIPPNSFALAETVEWIEMPRDVLAICVGRSTYARCGIIINTTPIEPEWRGRVTIEISNTTPLPAKIYAGEGIAQMLFLKGEAECRVSYADKGGKYQGQMGLTLPIVEGVAGAE